MIQQETYWNSSGFAKTATDEGDYPAAPGAETEGGNSWPTMWTAITSSVDESQVGPVASPYLTAWQYSNSESMSPTSVPDVSPAEAPADADAGYPPGASPADIAKKAEEAGMTVDEFLAFNDAEVNKNRANATPENGVLSASLNDLFQRAC